MPSNPSLEWFNIGDIPYSIVPCYDKLNWNLDNLYSNYNVTISTNSTLIAITSKAVLHPSIIDIYSIGGNKISTVNYNYSSENYIIGVAFKNECLCVVLSNQKFRYYQDFKGDFNEYQFTKDLITLDPAAATDFSDQIREKKNVNYITNLENNEIEEIYKVHKVDIWGKYLVLKLQSGLIITDLSTFKNYRIRLEKYDALKIKCMECILSNDDCLTLITSYEKNILTLKIDFGLNNFELTDNGLTDGPFSQISASPNGLLVALFNSEVSTIFVINNEFNQVLLEYDTSNESSLPYQIKWCGNDAIVLSLRDEIKLIGPDQQSFSYFYDIVNEDELDLDLILQSSGNLSFTIPILNTEMDGLKILTNSKVQFLCRVSENLIHLYQLGSSAPSSILLDCIDKVNQNSSKANVSISLLQSDGTLISAMNDCLQASLEEINPIWQKKILRAVSFGKAYNEEKYDSDHYLETVNYLRVMNQLRSQDVGIFVTFKQLNKLGWQEIILMLLKRDLYYLALKIIDILNLESLKDNVYIEWCCAIIKKRVNSTDLELYKAIDKKLSDHRISVTRILKVAHDEGRLDLCKLLIHLEPSILKKVKQYLNFEDLELALVKTFQSSDFDICKLILLHLQDDLSLSQFFRILNQNESKYSIVDDIGKDGDKHGDKHGPNEESLIISGDLVSNFWEQSIGKYNSKSLDAFYKLQNKKYEIILERLKHPKEHRNYYDSYKQTLLKSSHRATDKKLVKFFNREQEILELQKKLGEIFQTDFFQEKTLKSILERLIIMNQLKQAFKVVKQFKISNEKYWYSVLQTYSKLGEFDKLYQFVISSSPEPSTLRSPIGFQPFVETYFAFKGPKEHISNYISSDGTLQYSEKLNLFIRNEDFISAANEALKYKDVKALQSIFQTANQIGDEITINCIKGYLSRLGY